MVENSSQLGEVFLSEHLINAFLILPTTSKGFKWGRLWDSGEIASQIWVSFGVAGIRMLLIPGIE